MVGNAESAEGYLCERRKECVFVLDIFAIHRRFDYLGQRVRAELGALLELQILLFADEIVLVAGNITLHVADEYSRICRFGFNGSKSNVVVFSGRSKCRNECCWWTQTNRWERSNNVELATGIAKREEKLWKEEVKKKPRLRTYLLNSRLNTT